MANQKNHNLYFLKITKLLGINCHYQPNGDLPEVVIPDFVITQLSELLERIDSMDRYSIHTVQDTVVQDTTVQNTTVQDTTVQDEVSVCLKDIFHNLLIAANAFTQPQRKQALETVLICFQEIRASLLISQMHDLAGLISFAVENIQLACKRKSIQEQDLLIVKVLDAMNEMNSVFDNEQSTSNTLETIDMSYENLQLNMSYFAAREISLND